MPQPSPSTLFLDRDGVINSTADGYVNRIDDFVFIPGSLEAIKRLSPFFQRIVVVTNQAGVGYGYMKKSTLEAIHDHMVDLVEKAGGRIDRVFYCPARVSAGAACRKPNIGMALEAKECFPEIDLRQAWMVGDMDTDIEFGKRAEMTTVRIANDHLDEAMSSTIKADYYFSNLLDFAQYYIDHHS